VKRWPQFKNARLFPAIGDGAADHIGSCGLGKNTASLMVGTSAAMRIAFEGDPPSEIPQGLWCYRIDNKRVILGGALSDGGNLYGWCKRNFKLPADAEARIRVRGAAAHGLNVLPFFHGERSPGYHEDACGSVLGLTASHDAIDILQASMEAVAYRLADIQDRLKKIARIKTVVASGGALAASRVWTQIIADVLGRDFKISDSGESALRGAVLLALESVGTIEAIENYNVGESTTLAFHPTCHAVYQKARQAHDRAISKSHDDQS
jgi:gluconokinase